MSRSTFAVFLAVFLLFTTASAQKAEVTLSLSEPFFDALLDSIYQNFDPPEFSIAQNKSYRRDSETQREQMPKFGGAFSFTNPSAFQRLSSKTPACDESIRILRDIKGVRTAVRFREGKIFVPMAFSGNYEMPFVGCVEFSGWAESNIDLELDKDGQRMVGRIRVLSVNLNGSGGVGGTLIARLLQGSIDRKLNPIDILTLDKLTFAIPVSKSGHLQMKATAVRHEIANGVLNVVITYKFSKS